MAPPPSCAGAGFYCWVLGIPRARAGARKSRSRSLRARRGRASAAITRQALDSVFQIAAHEETFGLDGCMRYVRSLARRSIRSASGGGGSLTSSPRFFEASHAASCTGCAPSPLCLHHRALVPEGLYGAMKVALKRRFPCSPPNILFESRWTGGRIPGGLAGAYHRGSNLAF